MPTYTLVLFLTSCVAPILAIPVQRSTHGAFIHSPRFYFKPIPAPRYEASSSLSASVSASATTSASPLPLASAVFASQLIKSHFVSVGAPTSSSATPTNPPAGAMTQPAQPSRVNIDKDTALYGRGSFAVMDELAVAPVAQSSTTTFSTFSSPTTNPSYTSKNMEKDGDMAAKLAALANKLTKDDDILLDIIGAERSAHTVSGGGADFDAVFDTVVKGLMAAGAARLIGVISALEGARSAAAEAY